MSVGYVFVGVGVRIFCLLCKSAIMCTLTTGMAKPLLLQKDKITYLALFVDFVRPSFIVRVVSFDFVSFVEFLERSYYCCSCFQSIFGMGNKYIGTDERLKRTAFAVCALFACLDM